MKLQIVPARRGAQWVRRGFEVFFKRPLSFTGLFGAFLLAMLLPQLIPVVGSILVLVAVPMLTLGFMLATQTALQGGYPKPSVFVAPLRGRSTKTRALLQLGVAYAVAMVLIVTLSAAINDGRLQALADAYGSGKATPESLAALLSDARLQLSLLFFFGTFSLLSVPFWHAPALVYWGDQGAAKSLFFSTMACWRNKGAFLVYALTWAGAMFAFAVVSALVFSLIGQPQWAAAITMPVTLLFSAVFYVSLFFTFADCFELPDTPQPAQGAFP